MKTIQTMILATLFGVFFSCRQHENRYSSRFSLWVKLLEQAPDSVLTLMDDVDMSSLNEAENAEYALLRVLAKDKAGMDLSADTAIFQAREYFIRINDPEKAELACFFAGKAVYYRKEAATDEMKYYQEALDHVRRTNNHQLHGRILYNLGALYQ